MAAVTGPMPAQAKVGFSCCIMRRPPMVELGTLGFVRAGRSGWCAFAPHIWGKAVAVGDRRDRHFRPQLAFGSVSHQV